MATNITNTQIDDAIPNKGSTAPHAEQPNRKLTNAILKAIVAETNALGSAAYADVGTAAEQIPTNADLGSAAYADVGTAAEQIPTNADLGSAAYLDVATNAQAIAGTAGVLPDAAGVHSAIRKLAVGTVSQSGGVPTGAIIERGSNANGEYVRFADGTQICQIAKADASISIDVGLFGGFRSTGINWSYPIGFVAIPAIITNPTDLSAFGSLSSAPSASSVTYIYTSTTSDSEASRQISLVAIGRWF